VGQQGFWVCTAVAVLSLILLNLTGSAIIGDLVGITYFLGALGVRERSIAAAVFVFLCYGIWGRRCKRNKYEKP
jgi:hypothetical protein